MPLVLLSGPIAVGKTTVADVLIKRFGYKRVKSSDYLRSVAADRQISEDRGLLQALGDELDEQTDYRWLVSDVAAPQVAAAGGVQKAWLVDSVRKERQIHHFRDSFGAAILHVHIWAPEEALRARYVNRLASGSHSEGSTPYEEAVQHPNEAASRALRGVADVTFNLARIGAAAAAAAIAALAKVDA